MKLHFTRCSCVLYVFAHAWTVSTGEDTARDNSRSYGVDVSFPIHHRVSTNYPYLPHNKDPSRDVPTYLQGQPIQPLGRRHEFYMHHLDGCRKSVQKTEGSRLCDAHEYERLMMNKRQPQSMINMTETGFKKVKAPERLTELLKDFWAKNSETKQQEYWGEGNVYLNYWDNPTLLVSVDDTGLRGSGHRLKREIWSALGALMEEWTQQELQPSSMYGIRIYQEGAVMLPHVDRLPLVASAVINVAQDVDEKWPTEIYDHDGRAHNVTLEPFEMLLFESASCLHGHPFPLKGRFYASIFVHFEPTGKSLGLDDTGFYYLKDSKSQRELDADYKENTRKGHGGQSASFDGKLPPYLKRQSPEEEHWRKQHPEGWTLSEEELPPDAHVAAKKGKLAELELQLEEYGSKVLTERDEHGWQVLHQGVAGGNAEVVEFLVEQGADINARTHGGYGETPLRIAEKRHGADNSIVLYLKKMGALSIGPEL